MMAEALLRRGRRPASRSTCRHRTGGVNPLTVRVLGGRDRRVVGAFEVGDEYLGQRFDYVVTVCDQARRSVRSSRASPSPSTGATRTRPRPKGTEEERWPSSAALLVFFRASGADPAVHPARPARGPNARRRSAAVIVIPIVELHLLRHAHAGDPLWDGPDERRPVVGQGREAGRPTGPVPGRDRLPARRRSSPRPRSGPAQTAELVAEHLGVRR